MGAGTVYDLQVTGRGGVPADATAVVLNVTAIDASEETFLTVWPTGAARPRTSNLNPAVGEPPSANLVTVGVGDGGRVSVFNLTGDVHVVADVTAYYVAHDLGAYYTKAEVDALHAEKANLAPVAAAADGFAAMGRAAQSTAWPVVIGDNPQTVYRIDSRSSVTGVAEVTLTAEGG